MTEQQLLADALRRINRAGIAYMLTGSMASNYWGIPHTTHDLDFVIELALSAIPSLAARFKQDFYLDEASMRAALKPPCQFNAIDLRSALKIVFWVLQPTPFEQEMFARRLPVNLLGDPAWIATKKKTSLSTNCFGTESRLPSANCKTPPELWPCNRKSLMWPIWNAGQSRWERRKCCDNSSKALYGPS